MELYMFICVILVAFLLYRFSTRNHDYWRKRKVPQVEPWPLFGSTLDMFKKKPLFVLELERSLELGSIYGYFHMNQPILSVGDPELLENLLHRESKFFPYRREFETGNEIIRNTMAFKRGEDWKRIRKMMIQPFTTARLKEVVESVFEDCVQTVLQNFRKAAEKGKSIDLKRIYGAFTMDAIATAAFSLREIYNKPDNILTRLVDSVLNRQLKLNFHRRAGEDSKKLRRITLDIIQERRISGEKQNDFLQVLLDINEKRSSGALSDKPLSLDELLSQCVSFVMNGYETIASALSFGSYLLALNQDIQETLRAEVDAEMERNNGQLTHDVVNSMPFLEKVTSETLRMYPPVERLERQADADYKLGDTGINIPKGMLITVPVFAIHRDPKFWPNPEKFDPERFNPEEKKNRPKFCYLPFGAGPRKCLGEPFALIEIKFCLAYVIRHFKINTCPETKVPFELPLSEKGILQSTEIKVSLKPRNL